jgi:hypothetical protein
MGVIQPSLRDLDCCSTIPPLKGWAILEPPSGRVESEALSDSTSAWPKNVQTRDADFPVGASRRLENRRYEAARVHGTDARPVLEVGAHHEPIFSQVLPCSSLVLVLESVPAPKDRGRGRTRLPDSWDGIV